MRIVHMTSAHPWHDIRIFRRMCRSLAEFGHDVHLVVPREEGPSTCVEQGVTVHGLPLPTKRLHRATLTAKRVANTARRLKGDIYHFHDPELIPAALLLRTHGSRVIYDVHEDYPAQFRVKRWIPKRLRHLASTMVGRLEAMAARRLSGIVAATPRIAAKFPAFKTVLVQNFPGIEELTISDPLPMRARPHHLTYVGAITRERGLLEIVDAMGTLPEELNARLVLAGQFRPPSLQDEAAARAGWNRVENLGWCQRSTVQNILAQARIGLVTYLPLPNHLESQPNKLFEYMSAGLPVIASDFPHWRRIVGDANCGLLVDPEQPEAIAQAMQWLLSHPEESEQMGQRGREAVTAHFNWKNELNSLLSLYERLLDAPKQGKPLPSNVAHHVDEIPRAA